MGDDYEIELNEQRQQQQEQYHQQQTRTIITTRKQEQNESKNKSLRGNIFPMNHLDEPSNNTNKATNKNDMTRNIERDLFVENSNSHSKKKLRGSGKQREATIR